jgi:RNA polymerase sigma-70 factor, ECF subfamily
MEESEAPVTQWSAAEQDLIRQLQAGNEAAFQRFVEQYRSKVCAVAYRILGNRDDADDITQQVFVKVHSSIKSFEGRSSLYTWVRRITVNECFGFLRKKRLSASIEDGKVDGSLPTRVQMTPDPSPTSETLAVQRDFLSRLLARVPEQDRQLLLLRELEGYSVAQLAEAAGTSENTIKTRLFRTKRRLLATATQWWSLGMPRPLKGANKAALVLTVARHSSAVS